MRKIIILSSMCLLTGALYAAPSCPSGKELPFSAEKTTDINADGKNEKLLLCAAKEKGKSLFRIYDGKTEKILLSVVLDINPDKVLADYNLGKEGDEISVKISSKKKGAYTVAILERPDMHMEMASGPEAPALNFVFLNGVYTGMIETYDHNSYERSTLDYSEIRTYGRKGQILLLYKTAGSHAFPSVPIIKTEELLSAYRVKNGKLEVFYKKGDEDSALYSALLEE